MNIQENIENILKENLDIIELNVINDSYKHQGHAGDDGSGETHFTIQIKAGELIDLSRVKQHRKINDLIKPLMDHGLHALSIQVLK